MECRKAKVTWYKYTFRKILPNAKIYSLPGWKNNRIQDATKAVMMCVTLT